MNFLIFFISLIFSGIFYFFYSISNFWKFLGIDFSNSLYFESLSSNLIIESISFIIIWIIFYIYFTDFSFSKKIEEEKQIKLSKIDKNLILEKTKIFIKKYLYYFGFVFLYLGIYFIYKSFGNYDFSYLILLINFIFFSLFFINSRFSLFRDFIKINTILFSLYYLFYYSYLFFNQIHNFVLVDFINSLFLLSSFILILYNDKKLLNQKKFDEIIIAYFSLFLFVFFSFYIYVFDVFSLSYILFFVSFLLSALIYFFFTKISFLSQNISLLRWISFIFSYISIISAFYILIFLGFNFLVFLILCYLIYFNILVHRKFENYISFLFANIWVVFIIYYSYFKIFLDKDDWMVFLILSLVLSLEYIILTYFFEFKYKFDYYFLHIFSYVFNFFSIVFYLFYFKIDLFTIWIIFFIESFYIFLSYFKLRNLKE